MYSHCQAYNEMDKHHFIHENEHVYGLCTKLLM